MRLRSFTAKSLPDAMARVRERLGDDAVILQQQTLDEGGVRVTAALENDGGGPTGPFAGPEGLALFDRLSTALDGHRVPTGLLDRLISTCGAIDAETATLALAGAFDAVFAFGALPAGATDRPLMLMGPPGAGKTATAAKLAAHARIRGAEATLITLDLGKAGGLAQIGAFAEALGAELLQARDAESLRAAVAGVAPGRLVLIDTLGASPYDADANRELADWLAAADGEGVLVLPAGGDPMECGEIALTYAETGATRMIATRLDASRRLGGVLAAAQAGELALMGAGISATIGGGLRPLNPMALARLVLPEAAEEPDDGSHRPDWATEAGETGASGGAPESAPAETGAPAGPEPLRPAPRGSVAGPDGDLDHGDRWAVGDDGARG